MEEEYKKDEGFWDDKSSKAPMLIVIALLLAIGVGVYIFLTKYQTKKPTPNDTPNNINTPSDEATKSDDVVNSNGKKVYIYAKGFADEGPIAFTYDCVSEYCDIITTEKGVILYDEDKVQYRILSKYEQEQIFNSDSPAGGPLDKEGFKEIVPTRIFELEDLYEEEKEQIHNLYKIEKENYFVVNETEEQNKSLYNFKDYCEFYKDKCLFDKQLIGYNEQLYDLKTDTIIYELKDHNIYKLDINQNFTIVEFKDSFTYYSMLNEKNNEVTNTYENGINSYYLKNDQLYYIKDNKVFIETAKSEKIDFDNTNMTSLAIDGSMLLYLDNDNHMIVRNLNTNSDVYNSEIKTTKDLFVVFSQNTEGYSIVYTDYDALKTDEWYNSIDKDIMTDDFDVNSVKQCTNENYKDNSNCTQYVIGYKIKLDKDGKYLSKESYFAETGI